MLYQQHMVHQQHLIQSIANGSERCWSNLMRARTWHASTKKGWQLMEVSGDSRWSLKLLSLFHNPKKPARWWAGLLCLFLQDWHLLPSSSQCDSSSAHPSLFFGYSLLLHLFSAMLSRLSFWFLICHSTLPFMIFAFSFLLSFSFPCACLYLLQSPNLLGKIWFCSPGLQGCGACALF